MSTSVFARFGARIRKKSMCIWLVSMFVIALALPVWAGSKEKDEETLKNATSVLHKMLSDQNIPSDVIAKADCVIVLPNVKKFGFGIGGSGGRGRAGAGTRPSGLPPHLRRSGRWGHRRGCRPQSPWRPGGTRKSPNRR